MSGRIDRDFYCRDVLEVAPALLGQRLIRVWPDGNRSGYTITETEAYRGGEDRACHASRGHTPRTAVMFGNGGHLYMYLIYGMYWMMNVVTAGEGTAQAVLIRGLKEASGPGRLTRLLELDRSYYGEDLVTSQRIWVEGNGKLLDYTSCPRIGIDYAGQPWKDMPWRFLLKP
jgi:DNA-3-methyladenine glycosylase